MLFENRKEAGKQLALELAPYKKGENVVSVGLVRGGVVVAASVSEALEIPLDVVIVRKVGAPDNPELALGAISDEGEGVLNDELIAMLGVSKDYLRKELERQREIVHQRKTLYLGDKQSPGFEGKVVLLIDDGIATGASVKVAIEAIRVKLPEKIVLAVPVAPPDALRDISLLVDEVVCLHAPRSFGAVGAFYRDFSQVTDEEVVNLIHKR